MSPRLLDPDLDASSNAHPTANESSAPGRRRGFRLPFQAWVAISATATLGVFAAAGAASWGIGAMSAMSEEAAVAHQEWVSGGRSLLAREVEESADVMRATYSAGGDMEVGSEQLLSVLNASMLKSSDGVLGLQIVGVATAEGEFSGVGISPAAGQIGVSHAAGDKMSWRPWDGGVITELPDWKVTERLWYTAAVTVPDEARIVGPVLGLDGKIQYVVTIAEPGTNTVWMGSLPSDRIANMIEVAFPPAPRFHSATAVVRPESDGSSAPDAPTMDEPVELVSASQDSPNELMRRAAGELGDRASRTQVLTDESGKEWRISAGRIFPGNQSAVWVLASDADPAVGLNIDRFVLITIAVVLGLVAVATGVASIPSRRLKRLSRRIESHDNPEDLYEGPTRTAELVGVLDAVAARTERVNAEAAARAEQVSRLAALHLRTTEASHDRRNAVAAELHDGPVQTVIAAGMTLDPESREAAMLRHAQAELRKITETLTEDGLGPGGISERLAEVADDVSVGRRFTATVDAPDDVAVDAEIAKLLTRATRELLVNARKHSGAVSAHASLAATSDRVQLTVTDDGVGFRAPGDEDGIQFGFGLFSLQVQVEAIGGSLTVDDGTSAGAKVIITLPPTVDSAVKV